MTKSFDTAGWMTVRESDVW